MALLYHKDTGLREALGRMQAAGGLAATACQEAWAIIGRMRGGDGGKPAELGNLTKHGESRIKHCVKYDLAGGHRLVTVQHEGNIWLLTVGKHDDVDRWIDSHRGLAMVIDKRTQKVTSIYELPAGEAPAGQDFRPLLNTSKKLLEQLSDEGTKALCAISEECKRLEKLTVASSNEELLEAISGVVNAKLKDFLRDLAVTLRDHGAASAEAHIQQFAGRALRASDDPRKLESAVQNPINSDTLVDLRELNDAEFEHFIKGASFQDWMLFLHQDQRPVAVGSWPDPVLLSGVSGSGKTCVLVHRAKHLAERFAHDHFLVLALNPALANLLADLIASLCPPPVRSRIQVKSVGGLCREVVSYFEPDLPLQEYCPGTSASLDVIWRECYQAAKEELAPIIDSLSARSVNPERYLRDELTWVRSCFGDERAAQDGSKIPGRSEYAGPARVKRAGRAVAFSKDWRERVLSLLTQFEEKTEALGLFDAAAIALRAHRHIGRLTRVRPYSLNFRSILVDEEQDLGTVELEIVAALAKPIEDALFLAGDRRQSVFPKEHDLQKAGLEKVQRKYFRRNFRNARQILEAGVALMRSFGAEPGEVESGLEGLEVLDPQYSQRECAKPVVVQAKTGEEEIRYVAELLTEKRKLTSMPVVVVACGLHEDDEEALALLAKQYESTGLEVHLLQRHSRVQSGVYLSALETIKGFEFSTVIVTRCGAKEMPGIGQPEDEAWREARRLYVAMTRARDELLITHTGEPSRFITGIADFVQVRSADSDRGKVPSPTPAEALASAPQVEDSRIEAELQRLRRENARLKARRELRIQVSAKGAVSVYGLGRFPVSLYQEQWLKLLELEPDIRTFIDANASKLLSKSN
jgi:hypothetical protein